MIKNIIDRYLIKNIIDEYYDYYEAHDYLKIGSQYYKNSNITFSDIINLIERCKEIIKRKNDLKMINISYLGFPNGNDVSYSLQQLEIATMQECEILLFKEKIKDIETIKKYLRLNNSRYEGICDTHLSHEQLSLLEDFGIEIDKLNKDCHLEILKKHEKTPDGIKISNEAVVGYNYTEFIGDVKVLYYNINLINNFLIEFKQSDIIVENSYKNIKK